MKKEHLTLEGGKKLLDIVYDMSENSKRPISKNEYLERLYRIIQKRKK